MKRRYIKKIDSIRLVDNLNYVLGQGLIPNSPKDFCVFKIDNKKAVKLNALWHSRLPRCSKLFKVAYCCEYRNVIFAIAGWGNPVARMLPQDIYLELRRMAISPESPYNTATWFISRMIKEIKTDYPMISRVISYQDTEVHSGTIYKASGWFKAGFSERREWNRPSRNTPPVQVLADKVRWEKEIRTEKRARSFLKKKNNNNLSLFGN